MEEPDKIFDLFQQKYESHFKLGKFLGKGGFGEVREIIKNSKVFAGKLVKKNYRGRKEINSAFQEDKKEENILLQIVSPNIVKIHKIYEEKFEINGKENTYNLIVMEKAVLKDLKTLNKNLFIDNKIANLIYLPFKEIIGDHLLKFFCRQIVKGLEVFDRNELIHFDIKPENILIFIELYLKITDFGLLKDVSNIEEIRIPGGTPGYLSPEYYKIRKYAISKENAKKQDYFALGSTIFLLKYGRPLIKLKIRKTIKSEEDKENHDYIIDCIDKSTVFIRSDRVVDKDFANFLCSLIQIYPEERPSFEEIYRNKWLNKNTGFLKKLLDGFRHDEQKLIMELRKSDYLIEKKKEIERNPRKKFIFNKKSKLI